VSGAGTAEDSDRGGDALMGLVGQRLRMPKASTLALILVAAFAPLPFVIVLGRPMAGSTDGSMPVWFWILQCGFWGAVLREGVDVVILMGAGLLAQATGSIAVLPAWCRAAVWRAGVGGRAPRGRGSAAPERWLASTMVERARFVRAFPIVVAAAVIGLVGTGAWWMLMRAVCEKFDWNARWVGFQTGPMMGVIMAGGFVAVVGAYAWWRMRLCQKIRVGVEDWNR